MNTLVSISRLAVLAAVSVAAHWPAQAAHLHYYTATMSGAEEAPPNASPGTGSFSLWIDETAMTLRLMASYSGLLAPTTAAHIHCCTAVPSTGTAGVAVHPPSLGGFALGGTSGSYDMTFDMTSASSWSGAFITANGGTTSSALSALVAGLDAGQAYLNIHTSSFPGGEIRGFAAITAVPEPASAALALLALLAIPAVRRR